MSSREKYVCDLGPLVEKQWATESKELSTVLTSLRLAIFIILSIASLKHCVFSMWTINKLGPEFHRYPLISLKLLISKLGQIPWFSLKVKPAEMNQRCKRQRVFWGIHSKASMSQWKKVQVPKDECTSSRIKGFVTGNAQAAWNTIYYSCNRLILIPAFA